MSAKMLSCMKWIILLFSKSLSMQLVMIQLTGQGAIHSRLTFLNTQFYGFFHRHILCEIGHEPVAQFSS